MLSQEMMDLSFSLSSPRRLWGSMEFLSVQYSQNKCPARQLLWKPLTESRLPLHCWGDHHPTHQATQAHCPSLFLQRESPARQEMHPHHGQPATHVPKNVWYSPPLRPFHLKAKQIWDFCPHTNSTSLSLQKWLQHQTTEILWSSVPPWGEANGILLEVPHFAFRA